MHKLHSEYSDRSKFGRSHNILDSQKEMIDGQEVPISVSYSNLEAGSKNLTKRQHSSSQQLNPVNPQSSNILFNEFLDKDRTNKQTDNWKIRPAKKKNQNTSSNFSSNNIEFFPIQEINQPPALKPYYKILNQNQLIKLDFNPYQLRDRHGNKKKPQKENCFHKFLLCLKLSVHMIMYPIKGLNWLTMPNPDGQKASLTVLISLLWIAALSYLASWWTVSLSCSFDVSPYIIGVTLVPWLIALRQFESYHQINLYFKILVRQGVKAHSKNLSNHFREDQLEIEQRIIFGGSLPKMQSFEQLNQRLLKPSLSDLKIGLYQSYPSIIMQVCMLLGTIFLLYTAFIQSPLEFRALSINTQFLFLLGIIWLKLCINFFTKCIVRKSISAILILIYITYIVLTVILELQIIQI